MTLQFILKTLLALMVVLLATGCTEVHNFDMDGRAKSVKVGSRRITGRPITVSVVADDSAIFKCKSVSMNSEFESVPRDDRPLKEQVSWEKHSDEGVHFVSVYKDYGDCVKEIVKKTMETRFANADVTVSRQPVKADCIIHPEVFVEGVQLAGTKVKVHLDATMNGKHYVTEAVVQKRLHPANLAWEIPLIIGGYPASTIAVPILNLQFMYHNAKVSMAESWGQASTQLADQMAPN